MTHTDVTSANALNATELAKGDLEVCSPIAHRRWIDGPGGDSHAGGHCQDDCRSPSWDAGRVIELLQRRYYYLFAGKE